MKTSVNIFNNLNESFDEEFKKLQESKKLKEAEINPNELTKEQLWKLRQEIVLGSLYVNDYKNSFGIDPQGVCNFFDSFIEDAQQDDEGNFNDRKTEEFDNADELYDYYLSCENPFGDLTECDKTLNETGEWDDNDEDMTTWLEDMRLQAEEIARNIDGEVKTVKGFDAYQGPFAIIATPKHGDIELWYDQEDDTGRSFNAKVAHVGWLNGSVGDISLWLNQDEIPEEFIIKESEEKLEEVDEGGTIIKAIQDAFDGSDFTVYGIEFVDDHIVKFQVSAFGPDGEEMIREVSLDIPKSEDYDEVKAVVEDWMQEHNSPDLFYEGLKEEQIIKVNGTDEDKELDYIINDVTVLEPVSDGDVQAPDIEALLTLVDESLKADYGDNWGHINVLSSRIDEASSYALVDISTPEIIKEFEERGIEDAAIGKNLILENADKLLKFKVNSLNGITRFSKKTADAQSTIKEWIETEFLHEAMKAKVEMEELEKAKNEKETVENYIACKPELRMEKSNIDMFIEMSKQIKDEGFTRMVQDKIYGFAAEFPANIEVTNKDDKYELKFTSRDEIVEYLFGKEWAKDPTEEVPGNEVIGVVKESVAEVEFSEGQTLVLDKVGNGIVIFHYETEEGRDGPFESDIIKGHYFKDEEGHTWDLKSDFGIKGGLNESYSQFNIGDIEVVFNPETYECLYSIPSAEVKDKKINLTKIPSVTTPYDTNTIIKNYVETKFGRIPTEEEKEVIDNKEEITVTEPETEPEVEVQNTEEVIDEPVEEAELPEEPDEFEGEPTPEEEEDIQAETGDAVFVKIRPKQSSNIEDIRTKMLDGDTPKSSYIVVGEKYLTDEEWENLTSNLTNPQSWLEGVQPLDRKNYSFNVIKAYNSNAPYTLLIDPLGYNYPRYTAIIEE